MRNIFVYVIFSFLLFVSTFSSEVISLNQKRTEKLTSKKQFYSLSTEGEELNKKNVVFETIPTINSNPALLYISRTSTEPSKTSFEWSSPFFGKNRKIILTQFIKQDTNYIGITCPSNCDCSIIVYLADEDEIEVGDAQNVNIVNKEEPIEVVFHSGEGIKHEIVGFTIKQSKGDTSKTKITCENTSTHISETAVVSKDIFGCNMKISSNDIIKISISGEVDDEFVINSFYGDGLYKLK